MCVCDVKCIRGARGGGGYCFAAHIGCREVKGSNLVENPNVEVRVFISSY